MSKSFKKSENFTPTVKNLAFTPNSLFDLTIKNNNNLFGTSKRDHPNHVMSARQEADPPQQLARLKIDEKINEQAHELFKGTRLL